MIKNKFQRGRKKERESEAKVKNWESEAITIPSRLPGACSWAKHIVKIGFTLYLITAAIVFMI